jgi:hypothetical protein
VQVDLAALDTLSHEGKRHEIFEAAEHRGLFDPDGKLLHRFVIALLDHLAGLDEHLHPLADEIAGRQRLDVVDKGTDAAALGVAEHDDVFHTENADRIFQRR